MTDAAVRAAILINGPPASGKTTIGLRLAEEVRLPFLSRDTVKERLFDELGKPDRMTNRTWGRASLEVIWSLVAEFPVGIDVIVEAWFGRPPHDEVVAGLRRARVGPTCEVWCHAPGTVLAERYAARVNRRHSGHPDASFAPELARLAGEVSPMGIGPVYSVDTSEMDAVRVDAIADWVRSTLRLSPTAD